MVDYLRTTLHSFINNYQAVMWRLRECSLNDEQLGIAVGLSGNAIRNRRSKPDLWKLSDVERLANHFALPVTACVQLNQVLLDLPNTLKSLPPEERRRVERQLLFKLSQLESYNQSDWPVRYLLRMHQALINNK
ncbi:hypothetical protein [Spirosoma sp.]|uniref:hypothetical protein n=1 Tax=Spirosoma sp. TaxID=1899569 RepID=UPI0026304FA8|nr:hypothetical protein [Spirosoma sp.]MCX6218715.1 hypothetical protein [Spirosoma sp.]